MDKQRKDYLRAALKTVDLRQQSIIVYRAQLRDFPINFEWWMSGYQVIGKNVTHCLSFSLAHYQSYLDDSFRLSDQQTEFFHARLLDLEQHVSAHNYDIAVPEVVKDPNWQGSDLSIGYSAISYDVGEERMVAEDFSRLVRSQRNYSEGTEHYWSEFQSDIEYSKSERPNFVNRALWSTPQNFQLEAWNRVKNMHQIQTGNWQFWLDWYGGILAGNPISKSLIAELFIDAKTFWTGSDLDVNARIAGVVARCANARSSNAERIFINEAGLFDFEVQTNLTPDLYAMALDRVRDALDEFRAIPTGDNLRGAIDDEIERVERYMDKYQHQPLRVYEALTRAISRIDSRCENGELTLKEHRLNDFRTELDSSALDILQNDDHVKSAIQLRATARFERMSEAEQSHYLALMEFLAMRSAPALALEMSDYAKTATSDSAEQVDKDEARYITGSRAIRMREEVVRTADDMTKLGKGGKATWEFFSTIYSWFI